MPSINLAPGTQYIITARKRRMRLYTIALGIILIFVSWGVGLYVYVQMLEKKSEAVKAEITVADKQLDELRDEATRVELFEKRLTQVSGILDTHIGWEKVFSDLERLLPADTVITNFTAASTSPTISLRGTTQNMDQVALAFASLINSKDHPTLFESGTIGEIQREEEATESSSVILHTFSMTLQYNPAVLKNTAL